MEAFGDALRQAQDKLKIVDYSLAKVFPMTKDPKVIRSAIVNLHDAQVKSLDALLLFERTYKRVPAFPPRHVETKLRLFSEYCVKRYGLNQDMVLEIRELKQWAANALEGTPHISPDGRVQFRLEGFQVMNVPIAKLKSMLSSASSFHGRVTEVINHARGP